MLVLGIETSSLSGSVALVEGGQLLAERSLSEGQRSAQSLIPGIDALLRAAGRPLTDVRLIGVTIGPGSFTGLRVGTTAAKTLAYALGAQTVGVDTLDVVAAQAEGAMQGGTGQLHVALDAQRREVFAATFAAEKSRWVRQSPTCILPLERWLASLAPGDRVAGPAVPRLVTQLPAGVVVAPDDVHAPLGATVARLAAESFERGAVDDFWKLAPAYFRPSAAEEKAQPS